MPELSDLSREVHLWYLPITTFSEQELANHAELVLSPEERQRVERFAFAKDRRAYITAHWLIRRVLSEYLPVPSADWEFTPSPLGKPRIVSPSEGLGLFFNLSHTAGMVASAVTLLGEVGVDVETVKPRNHLNLARRYFAPLEVAQLEAMAPADQPQAFFRFWTLKEAYIKACGQGLSMDLASFGFPDVFQEEITIAFAEDKEDHPEHWSFFRHEPDPDHKIAVAVKRGTGVLPAFKIFQDIPKGDSLQ